MNISFLFFHSASCHDPTYKGVRSLSLSTRIDWNKKVTTSLCLASHSLFLYSMKFSSSSQRDRHFYFISFSFLVPPIYRFICLCGYMDVFFPRLCNTWNLLILFFLTVWNTQSMMEASRDESQPGLNYYYLLVIEHATYLFTL